MLIDELIADRASGSGSDISCLMPQLRNAVHFTLAPEFAAVADALSSDFTGLVRAFKHCRLPYPITWIEVAQADRPAFMHSEMQAPKFQTAPKRVGFLLTATREDLSAWKAHLFWSTDKGCSCPAMAMGFDMLNVIDHCDTLPTDEEAREQIQKSLVLDATAMDKHPGWIHSSEMVKLAMINHTKPIAPDYDIPMPPYGLSPNLIRDFFSAIHDLARSDWAGEISYVLAVIGLLNARNAVETQTVDYGRLNKARIRRGKLPLLEHKILRIARRQQRRVYVNGARGDYAPMRGHFVMGHWKVRRTGIFFWHPHARGSLKHGSIKKDYEVVR
jgi:hypothetical protein